LKHVWLGVTAENQQRFYRTYEELKHILLICFAY